MHEMVTPQNIRGLKIHDDYEFLFCHFECCVKKEF